MRALIEQLLKFGMVGGLGVLTNTLVFFLLVDVSGLPANLGSFCAFAVAVTQNFVINRIWTFSDQPGFLAMRKREPGSTVQGMVLQYAKFVGVSLGGLAVNLAVLNLVMSLIPLPIKTIANLVGVAAGMFVNFAGYKLWVFRKTRAKHKRNSSASGKQV